MITASILSNRSDNFLPFVLVYLQSEVKRDPSRRVCESMMDSHPLRPEVNQPNLPQQAGGNSEQTILRGRQLPEIAYAAKSDHKMGNEHGDRRTCPGQHASLDQNGSCSLYTGHAVSFNLHNLGVCRRNLSYRGIPGRKPLSELRHFGRPGRDFAGRPRHTLSVNRLSTF